MGVEFVDLFNQWADSYDDTVSGSDPEYKEVFEGYDAMLQELADLSISPVLEFGVGTANLTQKIVAQHKVVIGIEPSEEMRRIAKVKCPEAAVYAGDFIHFPMLQMPVRSIVSSFAFHHLNDQEKRLALKTYYDKLEPNGELIFIDTLFKDENYKLQMIKEAEDKGFMNLAQDLREEYYPYLEDLEHMFLQLGFKVTFKPLNKYAWLIQAGKGE
ncbi:class I SAM-dependent methyltransferase [Halobacillus sp. A5]|uniref:class I SAM-dependent DNA methyltransferase n=1 Tax=Halobacillus sp. A5 TaxID=2880263 RepID=UPI0020A6D43D|nr:class I SAM-dependent methyltransferase [Halobacillus sp. A5]MCP3028870.1 class I SAM-dependent methyltransferase [Halobacillus sp. A5]